MQTKKQSEHHDDSARQKRELLNALLEKAVIRTLGMPDELLRVQVRHLWDGQYRVNVFVGEDVSSAKVAHSFFLLADADGKIIKSNPAISRHYGSHEDALVPLPRTTTIGEPCQST